MERLFQNVIWPAIAGSVAWAFFTVLVGADLSDRAFWAKLLALLSVAVYLAVDWYRTDLIRRTIKRSYWIADAFLAPLIAVFAVATCASSVWAPYAIAVAFLAAIVGHLRGAWDEVGLPIRWNQRFKLAAINASGLVVLGIGYQARVSGVYSAPVAIAVVVSIFLIYSQKQVGARTVEGKVTPMLVSMTDNPRTPSSAVAIDQAGGVYLGQSGHWTRVATTAGPPASIWCRTSTGEVFIALTNGNLYRLGADWTLTLDSNVFSG